MPIWRPAKDKFQERNHHHRHRRHHHYHLDIKWNNGNYTDTRTTNDDDNSSNSLKYNGREQILFSGGNTQKKLKRKSSPNKTEYQARHNNGINKNKMSMERKIFQKKLTQMKYCSICFSKKRIFQQFVPSQKWWSELWKFASLLFSCQFCWLLFFIRSSLLWNRINNNRT